MKTEVSRLKDNCINLEDSSEYWYTVSPFEVTNALGAAIATLNEYTIISTNGEIYNLYKTKEGNWYDIPYTVSSDNNTILRELKIAIDIQILLHR